MAKSVIRILNGVCLLLFPQLCLTSNEVCDQRPLGAITEPLPPDNRFKIDILGVTNDYIPKHNYTVRLYSTDSLSTFIAFTISARGDHKENDKNPRKPIMLDPGYILPKQDSIISPVCNNSVIQVDITPKNSVEVFWIAPPKDNKCVTIYALLAVKPDVWYNFEGPLSKRVCEDRRNIEDMLPPENDNCGACEDARYLVTFEGLWSYNTHSQMFPKTRDLARFSDVVGASHTKNFHVYTYQKEASQGLKMLAAQGNTTELEMEISRHLGTSVRTVIKATSQPKPDMATTAIFRVTPTHHQVSLVAGIIPSPDWFLGVANMELCDAKTNTWPRNLTLNLYPLDAGTDSGATFEAANEDTMPPQPISSAVIDKSITKEQTKPFARLRFDLIRTYTVPSCETAGPAVTEEEDSGERERTLEREEETLTATQATTESPPSRDPDSSDECPITEWEEWLPCQGPCEGNVLQGYHMRFRYHLIDGVPARKYDDDSPERNAKEVSEYCLANYPETDIEECTETCEEPEEVTAQRRIWREPMAGGKDW